MSFLFSNSITCGSNKNEGNSFCGLLLRFAICLQNISVLLSSIPIIFLLSSTPNKISPPFRLRNAQTVSNKFLGSCFPVFLNSMEIPSPCAIICLIFVVGYILFSSIIHTVSCRLNFGFTIFVVFFPIII